VASPEFIAMVYTAGLLKPYGDQQKAIQDHCRELEADDWGVREVRLSGDAVVDFLKHGDETPVGRARVTKAGQVYPDVTEVIA
jgi:hypothetical protein